MAISQEEVVVRYRAEVDQLTKELDVIILKQEEIVNLEKAQGTEAKKQVSSQAFAANKRKQLIQAEEQELRKLAQLKKLAFDPKQIEKYNQQIAASQNKIKLLQGEVGGIGKTASSVFAGIGAGIAAAFSVQAITAFAKASINAFLEAEKNSERLKFAITAIGGESEAVFDRLIEQSKELQNTTIFSDDSVQSAQAALAAFDLTGAEIEQILPKLADFATVTQKSLEEAAQSVGQGLQGMGREFKKFGIEVSASASEQENLNKILSGFDQFAGAATNATKTLTGQLEQAKNRADELQENIGEKLAPSFVRARLAALEFAEDVIDFFLKTDEVMIKLLKTMGLFPKEVTQAQNSFKGFSQSILEQVNATKTLTEFDELAVKLRNDQTAAIAKQQAVIDRLIEAKEDALGREVVNLNEVRALNEAIAKQQSTNLQNEINKLGIIEEILTKQRDVKAGIKKEEKDNSDEIAKNEALLRKLQIENIEDLKQRRIAAFEEEIRQLTAKGKLRNQILIELEKQLKRDLDEIDKTLGNNIKPIELKVKLVPDEVVPVNPVPDKLDDRGGSKVMVEARDATAELIQEIDKFVERAEGIQDVVLTLADAWQLFTDRRLAQIETEKNAQLDALDIEQQAIDDKFDKRRISETDAARLTEQLTKKRVEAERQAAEKERAIKRKQAILDKANALIQITINTAQGVSKALAQGGILGGALAALITAAGVAQASIVASTPIAYRKGSKDTGARGHVAEINEDGREFVYMRPHSKVIPAPQTKKHEKALDAIFDNRFDEYVIKQYVTPRLVAQQKENEVQRGRSFSENVARSIMVSVDAPKQKQKDGMTITNWKQLGDHIIEGLKTDSFRR